MKTVGAYEARTHFNELLKKVSEGETIRITRGAEFRSPNWCQRMKVARKI